MWSLHVLLAVLTGDLGQLWTPSPQQYASGDFIPLAITISCPSSPALAKLYASNITVQMVKNRKIWFSQPPTEGRLLTTREMVLSAGLPAGRHECNAGTSFQLFKLKAGSPGREVNISVNSSLEVKVSFVIPLRRI